MAQNAMEETAKGGGSGGRRNSGQLWVAAIAVLASLALVLPTAVLFVIGMIPACVALVVDTSPGKYAFRCVVALNGAGVAPLLFRLWRGSNNITDSMAILSNPISWLVMFGAAAIGWLLFLGLPGIVTMVNSIYAEQRIGSLREIQHDLIQEWGESIATANSSTKGKA